MDGNNEILGLFLTGYVDIQLFEEWVYNTRELEETLSNSFYMDLISANFKNDESIIHLKHQINNYLVNSCGVDIDDFNDAFCEKRALEEYSLGNNNRIYRDLYLKFYKSRKEFISIDVGGINTVYELHSLLKKELNFPEFYGMSWDAFWDAITGLVQLPKKLIILGWKTLKEKIPGDAEKMKNLLSKLNEQYPNWKCDVDFQ